MDMAVIGAAGTCGRQSVMQMLDRHVIPNHDTLQLVGRRGGRSAKELWGLRADLSDAFDNWAPKMEVVVDPDDVEAELVVMMAGVTVSSDPGAPNDRAALGAMNAEIFQTYADALAGLSEPPIVVVQSNPVELAVEIFAERLGRHRVLGAAGWSDTMRFSRELAADLGIPRRDVQSFVVGQHGDYIVPVWSHVIARRVSEEQLADAIAAIRDGRTLSQLPEEIQGARGAMLELVREDRVEEAFGYVQSLPADLRAFVKPFFTHFTAGRTTEAVTARSAVDIVEALVDGQARAFSAQVKLEGELGVTGVAAVPVIIGPQGWSGVVSINLADDEAEALQTATSAIRLANAEARAGVAALPQAT